eukprot:1664171-Prymnesium_polylepis.1
MNGWFRRPRPMNERERTVNVNVFVGVHDGFMTPTTDIHGNISAGATGGARTIFTAPAPRHAPPS